MRLERLRIESQRQFREPVEIGSLNAGLNLFVGPNGVGKSTIIKIFFNKTSLDEAIFLNL